MLWSGMGCGILAAAALGVAVGQQPSTGLMIALVVALLLAAIACVLTTWGVAYRRSVYVLGDNALEVRWAWTRAVLPYAAIEGVFSGQKLAGAVLPAGPAWPGVYVGEGRVRGLGRLRYFSTSREPASLLVVTTQGGGLVLAAQDRQGFRAALIDRLEMLDPDATRADSTLYSETVREAPWSSLTDRWGGVCLMVAIFLVLAAVAVVSARFADLPGDLPLHFDAGGQPNEMGARGGLLRLPMVGFAIVIVDGALGTWLHPRERALARLVWLTGTLLQGVLLLAVIRLAQ